jgi:hypothetical protein
MQTVKMKRLTFVATAAFAIALGFGFYLFPGWPLLAFWQWAVIVNSVVICLLACATGARFGDFGAQPWIGVALILICLAVVPLAGPAVEQPFVPAEGIDHGAWQEDIPDYVNFTGIGLGLIVLAGAAVPRSRRANVL